MNPNELAHAVVECAVDPVAAGPHVLAMLLTTITSWLCLHFLY
jgi:hypothetical protein